MATEAIAIQADFQPMTAVQVRAQVNLVQEVMKAVMKDGLHYGTIPGCGDKPTLLKPGAEKLMMTFRLAADPQVEEIPTEDGVTFRVICRITNQATGVFLGSGIGECSSKEEKYGWRKAVCDEEFNETPEDKRRGKWGKVYGDKPAYQTKQVRTNPADVANTVLKMAKKRALVDAILTVTAASDCFTQDIEDMPAEVLGSRSNSNGSGKQALKQPQSKSQGAATQSGSGKPITEGQKKLIYAKSKAKGIEEKDLKSAFGVAHITDLTMDQMNDVVAYIDGGVMPQKKGGAAQSTDPEGCPKAVSLCGSSEIDADMNVVCGLNSNACPYADA